MTPPYDATHAAIERVIDDAHRTAAGIYLDDVRKNLAPFNLSRHRVHFYQHGMAVAEARRHGDPCAPSWHDPYWYEVRPRDDNALHQAIYAAGMAYDKLPVGVQQRLHGVVV